MAADNFDNRDGALVEMRIRSDGINILAKAYDSSGREIALPAKIVFYPQFFTVCEQVRLGTVEVFVVRKGEKSSSCRTAMDISGRTGTLRTSRIEEQAAVVPFFMTEPRVEPNPNLAPVKDSE